VGTIDPPAPTHGGSSLYGTYSYAGTVWHTYTSGKPVLCAGQDYVSTWVGNQLFNVGKVSVAAVNELWYVLGAKTVPLSAMNGAIAHGAKWLYGNFFATAFGVVAILVAVYVFWRSARGDLASVSRRTLWFFAGAWLAASMYLTPTFYTHLFGKVGLSEVHQLQAKALGGGAHALPNLLYQDVIYKTWKEGEFGSASAPAAKQHARALLDAQAYSKKQAGNPSAEQTKAKKKKFDDVAKKLKDTPAYPTFTGQDGSRIGIGFLGALRGFAYSWFPLTAEVGLVLGELVLKLIILTSSLIGLGMILSPEFGENFVKGIGRVLASLLALAVGSSAYLPVLAKITDSIPAPAIRLLALVGLTVVAIMLVRPFRQFYNILGGVISAAGSPERGEQVSSFRLGHTVKDKTSGLISKGAELAATYYTGGAALAAGEALAETENRPKKRPPRPETQDAASRRSVPATRLDTGVPRRTPELVGASARPGFADDPAHPVIEGRSE
jgi:hypothetical protein